MNLMIHYNYVFDAQSLFPDFDSYKIAIFLVPDYQQYIKNDDFLG